MALHWEESLKIGVPVIDEQHEEIFSKFDQLTQALEDGTAPVDIAELLNYLNRFAESHFAAEEELMRLYRYPGLDEQIRYHEEFKDNVRTLSEMSAHNLPAKEIAIKANATIIRYFINHVRKVDSKIASYINSANNGQ